MNNHQEEQGVCLEVLGNCVTNTKKDSQHDAKVEYKHLWSFAQEAALIAVSEKSAKDGCYHLILDPERRAKRIAGHYADLYFRSSEKTNGEMQFYWPALAAFVVKDIVEAYRYAREEVLHREWTNVASVARNSPMADLSSLAMTGDSPYQHVLRTYSALAKGNLWLFMDIHPWLWFFLEFGINNDGSVNKTRLKACLPERNWSTLQSASKEAVEELPYGPNWLSRLKTFLANDDVYQQASKFFSTPPVWSPNVGYGQHTLAANRAHRYCQGNVKKGDKGYRSPCGLYWTKFQQAFYVMESEHVEMSRIASDGAAVAAVIQARTFGQTPAVQQAYTLLIKAFGERSKPMKEKLQFDELVSIANQEQINVLQPLIYNDPLLKVTMDMNHRFSRMTGGWISPQFTVTYSSEPTTSNPELKTVFDAPSGVKDRIFGDRKSLPNQTDRMKFVGDIAKDFHGLMRSRREYMDAELSKIRQWTAA